MGSAHRLYHLGLGEAAPPSPWQSPDPNEGKSQALRAWELLVLGPVLIYAGTVGALGPILRWFLVLAGGGVIAFNAANYVRYARAVRA